MSKLVKLFSKVITNKNICYLLTRYITYGVQFLSSIYIAVILGPYYFGLWGFVLLLINYFGIFDFGIANATNMLIIKNNKDLSLERKYFTIGLLLVSGLNFLIFLFGFYNFFYPLEVFIKYKLENRFLLICIVAVLVNYNNLFMHIYRIRNELSFISLYQSIVPFLIIACVFVVKSDELLISLVLCYVIGNIVSMSFFYFGGKLPKLIRVNSIDVSELFRVGLFLFVYNVCFYLIVLSLRSFISSYYSIEEFGIFSFAFSLGNSILLFLQAISFLIYPKVVSKLNNLRREEILFTLSNLRRVYLTFSYLILFVGLFLMPYFLLLIPKYSNAFITIGLCSMTIILYSNSFGYGTFLMANKFEKINALISFMSLLVNVILCFVLVHIIKVSFNLVIIATMFSYFLYSYLCVYFTKKKIEIKSSVFLNLKDCFGYNILIPYLLALIIIFMGNEQLMILPLFLFIVLSKKDLLFVLGKIKYALNNPSFLKI